MKMESLAYAEVGQLTLVNLQLSACHVPARHQYVMHPAPVERFIYITKGLVCFFLGQDTMQANSRDMVYLPRDTAYRSQWYEDADFVVVDILLQDSSGQDIRFGECPGVLFHDSHLVYDSLLAELAQKADAAGPFDWLERLSLCFKLLCQMARDTNRQELDENRKQIQNALTYLENNYISDFPVDSLARMCSLSPASFRRLFFSCKGISPVDYRNRLRIRRAAELLRSGKYTVGEAAELVGIRDITYFGKLFKRYMGMSPGILKKGI